MRASRMAVRLAFPWPRRIRTWKRFNKLVANGSRSLLPELHRFTDCVLVAGCQRSGTTAVTRVIANSGGFAKFHFTRDDELDAALILAGEVPYDSIDRHCFQTTYLNDRYFEYFQPGLDFRLVWVIRNPFSVVYSMVYHWRAFALDDLFQKCGNSVAERLAPQLGIDHNTKSYSKFQKACFAYIGKSLQLDELKTNLPAPRLLIIDYDRLCRQPTPTLNTVFNFIEVPFEPRFAEAIHTASVDKRNHMKIQEVDLVEKLCSSTYEKLASHALQLDQN